MLIFQRMVTLTGPAQEVGPWAIEITEAVNERTELAASLWQGISGGPLGTMVWSSLVPSMTAMEAAMDTLAMDADYQAMVARAADWVRTPGEDRLLRVAHSAGGEYVRPDVGAYAEGTAAVPAEGRLAAAAEFGVAMADRHADLTHSSVLFCTNEYAQFGEMQWLALYADAAALDHSAESIAKDDAYTAAIDGAGGLFTPGQGGRTLARRIA